MEGLSVLVPHRMAVRNLLLGSGVLFDLYLPETWALDRGLAPPEVVAVHEREGQRWVASGRAWYVVYHPERRWALEMAVRIAPLPPRRAPEGMAWTVNGHPAQVRFHQRRRGLPWRRHTVKFMTIAWFCPQSERYLEVEFSGWCPEEGFAAMREAVRYWRCHGLAHRVEPFRA